MATAMTMINYNGGDDETMTIINKNADSEEVMRGQK